MVRENLFIQRANGISIITIIPTIPIYSTGTIHHHHHHDSYENKMLYRYYAHMGLEDSPQTFHGVNMKKRFRWSRHRFPFTCDQPTKSHHTHHPFHFSYHGAGVGSPTGRPPNIMSPSLCITTLLGPTYALCRANHHAATNRESPPVMSEV